MARKQKRLLIVLVVIALLTGGAMVLAINYWERDPFDAQPFNPSAWASAKEEDRGLMARDAIRHVPLGTTAARVRELLGEPNDKRDPRGPVRGYNSMSKYPELWSYYLGSWSGIGRYRFDSAFLNVHFDIEEGCVVKVEITGG